MHNLNDIPYTELAQGIMAKLVHGKKSTLSLVEIRKGSVMPVHSHKHEQITFIVEGELEMQIGKKKILMAAGTVHVIPSNTPHSARALTDCRVIDVFSPVREDYRKMQEPAKKATARKKEQPDKKEHPRKKEHSGKKEQGKKQQGKKIKQPSKKKNAPKKKR